MSTILNKFRVHSERWHRTLPYYDYRGRANVFGQLIDRHGRDAVLRHRSLIRQILDKSEGLCVIDHIHDRG